MCSPPDPELWSLAISCYHSSMAQLLVRHLDDDVKAKLQIRARRHGHSTEEEVREILRNAVRDEGGAQAPLGSRLAARFAGLGLTQDIPELRGEEARPADFES
jgi:antitoxin FitA